MSSIIENISVLHYSPYILVSVFESFYEENLAKTNDILLSYLILPLILPTKTREFFKNAKSNSTLHTFSSTKEHLYGIEDRIQQWKIITNHCLLLAKQEGVIDIESDMSVIFKAKKPDCSAIPKDMLLAARKLNKILSQYDLPTCYRILGVKKL